jgi:hypothetical protein
MKNSMLLLLTLSTLLLSTACKKEAVIADPTEGKFAITLYDENGDKVFTHIGDATYLFGGKEVRLADPDFGQADQTDNTFAWLVMFPNEAVIAPVELGESDFDAFISKNFYQLYEDWGYEGSSSSIHFTEVNDNQLKAEFELKLDLQPERVEHPEWGANVTIKGKFFAVCEFTDHCE